MLIIFHYLLYLCKVVGTSTSILGCLGCSFYILIGQCFGPCMCCAGQPKRHLLTTGWSVFVSAKRLVAGDSIIFIWYFINLFFNCTPSFYF